MNGEERRAQIVSILEKSSEPIAGGELAKRLNVTRQAIVQDIALLRANGKDIFSANRGYVLLKKSEFERIFKLNHSDEDVEAELMLIVDLGGKVKDIFVFHKVYGVVKADMNIRSRKDIAEFIKNIRAGKSSLLKNVTAGYHYHTVVADSEQTLDEIEIELKNKGFLAKLSEYEPDGLKKVGNGEN